MNQPVIIMGTGALACLFAARLASTGSRVTMVGTWPAGLEALRNGGVCYLAPEGEQRYPVQVLDRPQQVEGVCYALVLVKAWQTGRAAQTLAGMLPPDGLALTLQNGLGNRETLAQALGPARVALGVTTTGATLLGPGRVRPGGEGVISLEAHPKLPPLVGMLRAAAFTMWVAVWCLASWTLRFPSMTHSTGLMY